MFRTIVQQKIVFFILLKSGILFGAVISQGPSLPYGVAGHSSGIINNKVLVVGGSYWSKDKTEKVFLKKSLIFEDGHWDTGPEIPLELYCSMYDYNDSGLYIVGGISYKKLVPNFLYLKSVDNKIVVESLPSFPEGIADGSAAIYKSKMYISCPTNSKGPTNSMWSIDLKAGDKCWVQNTPLPGPKRAYPAMVKCGDKIFLLGGLILPEFKVLKDAYAYYPEKDKWEKLANLPSPCYGFGARAIDENRILIAGIGDEKIHNSIWLLDTRDMSVQNIGESIVPTVGASLVQKSKNTFWLIGGEPDANKNRTDVITVIKLD